jgi:hypothetical protein
MNASQTTAPVATTPRCECGLWEDAEGISLTGCNQNTSTSKKTFLPGHDAKLKGALIKAKHAGTSVVRPADGGDVRTEMSPVDAASRFGFAAMVANATPRAKKAAAPAPEGIAEVIAQAEAAEIAADEAKAVEAVRKATAPRPRRTRKAVAAGK